MKIGVLPHRPYTGVPKKYVIEFRCKKCRKNFLEKMDEKECKSAASVADVIRVGVSMVVDNLMQNKMRK